MQLTVLTEDAASKSYRYTKSKLPTLLSRIKIECVYILKNIWGVLGPLKGNQELINMQ